MSDNDEYNYTGTNQDVLITDSNHGTVKRFISQWEEGTPNQQMVLHQEGPESKINTNDQEPHDTRRNSQMAQEEANVKAEMNSYNNHYIQTFFFIKLFFVANNWLECFVCPWDASSTYSIFNLSTESLSSEVQVYRSCNILRSVFGGVTFDLFDSATYSHASCRKEFLALLNIWF